MMRIRILAMLALVVMPHLCAAQTFVGLGFAPGDTFSQASAVSADGSTIAAHGPIVLGAGYRTVWRWRLNDPLDMITTNAIPWSLSADGAVVSGAASTQTGPPAFRWTAAGGLHVISEVHAPLPGMSGDGLVLVGAGPTGGAVRWTQAAGPATLPNPDRGTLFDARAQYGWATSNDGSVVVGAAFINFTINTGHVTAFRWTPTGGTQILTLPGGGYIQGAAVGVSSDGSTVIAATSAVYRWQAATNFVEIPGLPVNATTAMPALSGDGNTIVSIDKIWNVNSGTRDLGTILTEAGCDFSGWSGLVVTGVDFDGNTFCGYGTHQGLTEAWYASVPAPTSLAAFLLGALTASRRRRVA